MPGIWSLSKKDANYRPAPKPEVSCRVCEFMGPRAPYGTCKYVRGVIQGSATIYAGHTQGARQTYKYFAPALDSTRRLLDELSRDQSRFTDFLVSSSKVLTAVSTTPPWGTQREKISASSMNSRKPSLQMT